MCTGETSPRLVLWHCAFTHEPASQRLVRDIPRFASADLAGLVAVPRSAFCLEGRMDLWVNCFIRHLKDMPISGVFPLKLMKGPPAEWRWMAGHPVLCPCSCWVRGVWLSLSRARTRAPHTPSRADAHASGREPGSKPSSVGWGWLPHSDGAVPAVGARSHVGLEAERQASPSSLHALPLPLVLNPAPRDVPGSF